MATSVGLLKKPTTLFIPVILSGIVPTERERDEVREEERDDHENDRIVERLFSQRIRTEDGRATTHLRFPRRISRHPHEPGDRPGSSH